MDQAPKSVASTQDVDEPASEAYVLKRRSPLPFLLGLLIVLGGIAGTIYYLTSRPDPFKVLIAVDVEGQWWEGSKSAAQISDEVSAGLKKIGFETVTGGDPEVDKILSKAKSPEEAAKQLGAGFLIVGEIVPEVIEHPVGETYFEIRGKAKLRVRFVGDDEGKAEAFDFTSWSGAPGKAEAMKILSEQAAERIYDAAVPRITDHPVIREKLESKNLEALVRLDAAKKYVDLRQRQLDEVRKGYATLEKERVDGGELPRRITYYGSFAAMDALAAVTKEGPLVRTQDVSPFLNPSSLSLGWINELETLAIRGADGKDRVLWSGYHLYGYPSAAPEGTPIVFVEDLFGWAKTLTVVEADGSSRRIAVDPKARFVNPDVAPGGKWAALYRRPCRGCPSDFVVLALADGNAAFTRTSGAALGDDNESYGGYAWLDDHRVVYLVDPTVPENPDEPLVQELRIVDLSADPPSDARLLGMEERESCKFPDASADGKSLVLACSGDAAYALSIIDIEAKSKRRTSLTGHNPNVSADGKSVAYSRQGDIFVGSLSDFTEVRLTKNPFLERYARFSGDAKRVYFESQSRDPNYDRRTVSMIASVEVP